MERVDGGYRKGFGMRKSEDIKKRVFLRLYNKGYTIKVIQ